MKSEAISRFLCHCGMAVFRVRRRCRAAASHKNDSGFGEQTKSLKTTRFYGRARHTIAPDEIDRILLSLAVSRL